MFDTMTLTKTVGALCGMFLLYLLGSWAAESIYHPGHGGGHGEEHAAAYVIETDEGESAGEVEEGPAFEEVLASADVGKGERVFGKCKACHKLEDGANGTGPHLFDVVGRSVGSIGGFDYSGALVAVAETWGPEELNGFLESPKNYAPGTKMGFAGLKKIEDRANLIAYLDTIGN